MFVKAGQETEPIKCVCVCVQSLNPIIYGFRWRFHYIGTFHYIIGCWSGSVERGLPQLTKNTPIAQEMPRVLEALC